MNPRNPNPLIENPKQPMIEAKKSKKLDPFFKEQLSQETLELFKKEPRLGFFRNLCIIFISIQVLGTIAGFSMVTIRHTWMYILGNAFSLFASSFGMYYTIKYKVSYMALYGAVFYLAVCLIEREFFET